MKNQKFKLKTENIQQKMKKLENMAVMILILLIVALFLALGQKACHAKQSKLQNVITTDSTDTTDVIDSVAIKVDNQNNSISIQQSNGSDEKSVEYRSDPNIKTEQEITCADGEYDCDTYGWAHNKIVWSSHISGTIDDVKKRARYEKRKCDHFLFDTGNGTYQQTKEIEQQH